MKIITLLVLCLLPNITLADTIFGRVIGVTDGDTITVLDSTNTQLKIRLSGIDAPEKKQDFGSVSKQSLSAMVFDKKVTIDWAKEDRYGRIVGKVYWPTLISIFNRSKLAWHGSIGNTKMN